MSKPMALHFLIIALAGAQVGLAADSLRWGSAAFCVLLALHNIALANRGPMP